MGERAYMGYGGVGNVAARVELDGDQERLRLLSSSQRTWLDLGIADTRLRAVLDDTNRKTLIFLNTFKRSDERVSARMLSRHVRSGDSGIGDGRDTGAQSQHRTSYVILGSVPALRLLRTADDRSSE